MFVFLLFAFHFSITTDSCGFLWDFFFFWFCFPFHFGYVPNFTTLDNCYCCKWTIYIPAGYNAAYHMTVLFASLLFWVLKWVIYPMMLCWGKDETSRVEKCSQMVYFKMTFCRICDEASQFNRFLSPFSYQLCQLSCSRKKP